ncbi:MULTISPECIES: hypothetical protein [unclassified Devosia]|uniref:hypothetical protein n=1 Tax=unclassified Devosia TaxID=196773 RepID=UPI0015517489|nr:MULTISPECIES: hypothetical protein [unclassified Devosia]
MFKRTTALVLLTAGLCSPALAQAQQINGVDVPADQLGAVQARCDELSNNNAPAGTGQASAATSAATPDATAGTNPSAPSIGGTSPLGGNDGATDASNSNAAGSVADPATPAAPATSIDLASIDIEACQAGGFTTGAASNSAAPETPAATTTNSGASAAPTTN